MRPEKIDRPQLGLNPRTCYPETIDEVEKGYLSVLLYSDDVALLQKSESELRYSVYKLSVIGSNYNRKFSASGGTQKTISKKIQNVYRSTILEQLAL